MNEGDSLKDFSGSKNTILQKSHNKKNKRYSSILTSNLESGIYLKSPQNIEGKCESIDSSQCISNIQIIKEVLKKQQPSFIKQPTYSQVEETPMKFEGVKPRSKSYSCKREDYQNKLSQNLVEMIKKNIEPSLESHFLSLILLKGPRDRSIKELQFLKDSLQQLEGFNKVFENQSESTGDEKMQNILVYQNIYLRKLKKMEPFYLQGEDSSCCYIILKGDALILKQQSEDKQIKENEISQLLNQFQLIKSDYNMVKKLFQKNEIASKIKKGSFFGEVSIEDLYQDPKKEGVQISNNLKRKDTAICISEEVVALYLENKIFIDALQIQAQRQVRRISKYLRNMNLLKSLDIRFVDLISTDCEEIKRNINFSLFREGDQIDFVYFIIEGEIKLSQTIQSHQILHQSKDKSINTHASPYKNKGLKQKSSLMACLNLSKGKDEIVQNGDDESEPQILEDIKESLELNKFYKPPIASLNEQKNYFGVKSGSNSEKVEPNHLRQLAENKQFQYIFQKTKQKNLISSIVSANEFFGGEVEGRITRNNSASVISSSAHLIRISSRCFFNLINENLAQPSSSPISLNLINVLKQKNQTLVTHQETNFRLSQKTCMMLAKEHTKSFIPPEYQRRAKEMSQQINLYDEPENQKKETENEQNMNSPNNNNKNQSKLNKQIRQELNKIDISCNKNKISGQSFSDLDNLQNMNQKDKVVSQSKDLSFQNSQNAIFSPQKDSRLSSKRQYSSQQQINNYAFINRQIISKTLLTTPSNKSATPWINFDSSSTNNQNTNFQYQAFSNIFQQNSSIKNSPNNKNNHPCSPNTTTGRFKSDATISKTENQTILTSPNSSKQERMSPIKKETNFNTEYSPLRFDTEGLSPLKRQQFSASPSIKTDFEMRRTFSPLKHTSSSESRQKTANIFTTNPKQEITSSSKQSLPPPSNSLQKCNLFEVLYPKVMINIQRQINVLAINQQKRSGTSFTSKPLIDTISFDFPQPQPQPINKNKIEQSPPLQQISKSRYNSADLSKEKEESPFRKVDNKMFITYKHLNLHKIFPESQKSNQTKNYFSLIKREYQSKQELEKKQIKLKNSPPPLIEKLQAQIYFENKQKYVEKFNFTKGEDL